MSSDRSPVRRLLLYFLLAFAGTWAFAIAFWLAHPTRGRTDADIGPLVMGLSYIAVWAPSAAGLLLAWRTQGSAMPLLRRLWQWPGARLILLALALPLAAQALGAVLGAILGEYAFRPLLTLSALHLLLFIPSTLISGPLGEEFGWRGFAQDQTQHIMPPLAGALLIGAAWSLWHLPAFVVPGLQRMIFPVGLSFPEFAAFTLSGAVVMAWLTNRARGALLPAILFHFGLLTMLLATGKRPPLTLTIPTIAIYAGMALLVALRRPDLDASARNAPARKGSSDA